MTKIDNTHNVEQLYRRYQETRDNIPPSVFSALKARAEEMSNEESIHAILQAAKVYRNGLTDKSAEDQERTSWLDSLKSKLNFFATPQFGGAFACLALALAIAPFVLDRQPVGYAEVAHLSDCQQCDVYLSNATASTRSAGTGLSQLNVATKTAAKLGRINAGLKIESLNDPQQAIDTALSEIAKLPKSLISAELNGMLSDKPSDLLELSTAISDASQVNSVTNANEALIIADVSIRHAAQLGNVNDAKPMLEKAITAFEAIPEPTILQKANLSKLKAAASKPLDIEATRAISAASNSLGR